MFVSCIGRSSLPADCFTPADCLLLVLTLFCLLLCSEEYYLLRFTHVIIRLRYLNLRILYRRSTFSIIAEYLMSSHKQTDEAEHSLYTTALFYRGWSTVSNAISRRANINILLPIYLQICIAVLPPFGSSSSVQVERITANF